MVHRQCAVSERQRNVHFFFNCFCPINVPNDFSGGNTINAFRTFIYKCNTLACDCREQSEVGITNMLTLINFD